MLGAHVMQGLMGVPMAVREALRKCHNHWACTAQRNPAVAKQDAFGGRWQADTTKWTLECALASGALVAVRRLLLAARSEGSASSAVS